MIRTLLISLIVLLSCSFLPAQVPAQARFEEVLFDFGKIQAKAGTQTHIFQFKNIGKDTLVIEKIKVSEPSLSASSDKMRYGPGEKGKLAVNYTPKNENGKVTKYISIRSNDSEFAIRQLTIRAEVIAGKRTVEDEYPEKIGNLRFKTIHLSFDQLKNDEVRTDTFRVYNEGGKKMTLAMNSTIPYTKWTIKPAILEPGKSGWIAVTFNAPLSGIWGLNYEPFILTTNDSLVPDKTISVGVNIVEDFSKLTEEQRNNPPKIEFATLNHDFGEMKQGAKVTYDFSFKNVGKTDLVIRRTKASCGCTAADPEKKILKPGESSFIKVNFDATGMMGEQHKTVMVITKDQCSAVNVLTFSARVTE